LGAGGHLRAIRAAGLDHRLTALDESGIAGDQFTANGSARSGTLQSAAKEIDDFSIPDGRNAAPRLFGSLESASLAVTFAAPLESSMDPSAAKLWNHGLPSLKRAERDCGISG
jgi:hypothetical protein